MSDERRPELENPFEGEPFGWIQWKGTNVCMDIHCPNCGLGHIDAEFAYYIRCSCGQIYAVSGFVKLIPVGEEYADGALSLKDVESDD